MAARPEDELGCLYWSPVQERFEAPTGATPVGDQGLVLHFGRPGGVVPQAVEG